MAAAETPRKVAVITGGASGIGQNVAQTLAARGGWSVHVFDVKPSSSVGTDALGPNTFYHQADTTNYAQLAAAFKDVFSAGGKRLDFVFANAGILERANWFAESENPDEPPPEPDWSALEINLKGCMNTVRLGRHYMVQNRDPEGGAIVVTASSAGIWPSYCAPIYTASKHGVVGFMRCIADWYYTSNKIRVNALCPSAVRTTIVPEGGWDNFPADVFTPLEVVTGVVLKFLDGEAIEDSKGVKAEKNYGQAIIPSATQIYHNVLPPFGDERHRNMAESTRVENALGHLI